MSRFLTFCSLLLVGFVLANAMFVWIVGSFDWNFSKAREAAAFKGEDFKVLVLGNSTALDGVNTEMLSAEFGKSYNFALGGASLEASLAQLQMYLRHNEKPDKVLLFLSSCHVNYQKQVAINPIIEAEESEGPPRLGDIPLYKFRWLFIENVKKVVSREHRLARVVQGQLRIDRIIPDETSISMESNGCGEGADYGASSYDPVWRINRICRESGVQFYLFEMPCWTKYQNACLDFLASNGSDTLVIHNLNNKDVCKEISPSTHWLSENHLNYMGSIELTRKIILILRQSMVGA